MFDRRRPRDWRESEYKDFVRPGAFLWLVDLSFAEEEDPVALRASGLEYGALNHPVVVVSYEGSKRYKDRRGRFGVCMVCRFYNARRCN